INLKHFMSRGCFARIGMWLTKWRRAIVFSLYPRPQTIMALTGFLPFPATSLGNAQNSFLLNRASEKLAFRPVNILFYRIRLVRKSLRIKGLAVPSSGTTFHPWSKPDQLLRRQFVEQRFPLREAVQIKQKNLPDAGLEIRIQAGAGDVGSNNYIGK